MKRKTRISSLGWIIIGLILHAVGGIFFNSNKPVCYGFCALGLLVVVMNSVVGISPRKPFTGPIQFLFVVYMLWTLYILVRPFLSSEPFTADGYSLINRHTMLAYFMPLCVFLGFKNLQMETIFKYSYIYGIIGVILFVITYNSIFSVNQNFGSDDYQAYIGLVDIPLQFLTATAFMLLCYSFVSGKYRILSVITMLVAIVTVLFTARRGSVFMYLLIFVMMFYLYVVGSKKGKVFKLLFVALLILAGFAIFNLYADSTFSFFLSRLDEDTRSGVEDYFYRSFQGKDLDWAIGRGLNGAYYCPIFSNPNRQMIETGYLHLILKGGIVYLVLFVFFLGHSAYRGLFRTNNNLTKGMALYLIAHIIYLFPFGLPSFSFEYLLVWVSILYCQSGKWRNFTNDELLAMIKPKRLQTLPK